MPRWCGGRRKARPHRFDIKRHLIKAALLAVVLTGIYYANYVNGWITADDLTSTIKTGV